MTPLAPPSRRSLLAAAALIPAGATAAGAADLAPTADGPFLGQVVADLERYVGFGVKASGGPGDTAAGEWMAQEAARAGFTVRRQAFEAPFFAVKAATLGTGGVTAAVMPQAVVTPTGDAGVEGPLAHRPAWLPPEVRCDGAIALVELPYQRWSTLVGPVEALVRQAFAAGAAAVVIVTTGPTHEAIALNVPAGKRLFDRPVAVLAPKDAAPFFAAARQGARGRLVIAGAGGTRPAFNVAARIDRGARRGMVVSTPRSGWTPGGGERGGGVAAWLALLRWAPRALPKSDLTFLATSGHEYENLGGERLLASTLVPPPAETPFWLHLGANIAARDWFELRTLTPQDGADSQRILMVTPQLAAPARRAFAGQPGLETVQVATPKTSAGELTGILRRRTGAVAGVFGAHRFHHVASDDFQKTEPAANLAAIESFKALVLDAMAG